MRYWFTLSGDIFTPYELLPVTERLLAKGKYSVKT